MLQEISLGNYHQHFCPYGYHEQDRSLSKSILVSNPKRIDRKQLGH